MTRWSPRAEHNGHRQRPSSHLANLGPLVAKVSCSHLRVLIILSAMWKCVRMVYRPKTMWLEDCGGTAATPLIPGLIVCPQHSSGGKRLRAVKQLQVIRGAGHCRVTW